MVLLQAHMLALLPSVATGPSWRRSCLAREASCHPCPADIRFEVVEVAVQDVQVAQVVGAGLRTLDPHKQGQAVSHQLCIPAPIVTPS